MNKKSTQKHDARGEVLIALLKEKSDFAILQEQGWYRIPVASAPRRWPPKWLAFYPEIQRTINNQGGLSDEGLVPRIFYPKTGATQITLFERATPYLVVDIGAAENLEL
jgi:hypothetical protein